VAAGEPSSLSATPERTGHSIECRVYAEDPNTFLPSPGRITTLTLPDGVRADFGYDEGDEVPMFYDPLIGKLVSFGADRDGAIEAMLSALVAVVLEGPKTNVATHRRVLSDERFVSGRYDTGLLGT
jgi:acetyl-CoA carboxylase biotin carboxylase subunit